MNGLHTVTVRHNFETAHRLPALGGKCVSLHGHSWWVELTIAAPYDPQQGTVVEYGAAKRRIREWVDTHLDHGVMLGREDPLLRVLAAHRCKLYGFDTTDLSAGLRWPTVENVAELLARVGNQVLADLGGRVIRCRVQETHVNAAEWTAPTASLALAVEPDRAGGSL